MAAEQHPRRASTTASAIPPAPPLPPPRKANLLTRLVTIQPFYGGSGSRPPSVQSHRNDGGRGGLASSRPLGIASFKTQEASHKTGLEISALDINQDRTHAVLAGRELLKTIKIEGTKCTEVDNLRSAVLNAKDEGVGQASSMRPRDTFEIHDVKWSHGNYKTHIATAGTNGKVILYDLNRIGQVIGRLHEHNRQVHKLAFSPHIGHLLLSGSHDNDVRLWDLRDLRKEAMAFHSRCKYAGMSGGIRDVKWSPTEGFEFAFGTDDGVIQRWDQRQLKGPKLKINAHDGKAVFAIDWHPDGKHLLSASKDKTVRIWDFASDVRRQKPAYVLRTPHPVHHARWRPPCWQNDVRDRGSFHCTQIATSYDRDHAVAHIWDFRRPYLPFREINRYGIAPSDMIWHSRDLLWMTGGREGQGMFTQTDVAFSPKTVDRRNMQTLALSSTGEVGAFAQSRRPANPKPSFKTSTPSWYESKETLMSPELSSYEKSNLRSFADDSIDDSFLERPSRRHHGRTVSNRSTKSFGSTPPSGETNKVVLLTDSLVLTNEPEKSRQVAIRGPLPGFVNVQVFTYLATKYKSIIASDVLVDQIVLELQGVFGNNAKYAERASFHRCAETWRIVGHAFATMFAQRIQKYHSTEERDRRLSSRNDHAEPSESSTGQVPRPTLAVSGAAKELLVGPQIDTPAINGQTAESTSNVPTPLARPVALLNDNVNAAFIQLPQLAVEDAISLPRPIAGPHSSEDRAPYYNKDRLSSQRPGFSHPQWYGSAGDLNERRALAGSHKDRSKAMLSLEPSDVSDNIDIRGSRRLDRHNSDESFAMFSASADSQQESSMTGSFASLRSHSQSMDVILEDQHQLHGSNDSRSDHSPQLYGRSSHQNRQDFHSRPILLAESVVSPKTTRRPAIAQQNQDMEVLNFSFEKRKATHEMDVLHQHNQLLRHDSSESEALMSMSSNSRASSRRFEHMEASGTIVPEEHTTDQLPCINVTDELPEAQLAQTDVVEASPGEVRLSDLMAPDAAFDTEADAPFAVVEMIRTIIQFHTDTLSDAQSASVLLLLVAPLLPPTHAPPGTNLDALKSAYCDMLPSLGMTESQIHTVKHTHVDHLLRTGVNPFHAEAIISTYHTQLHSLGLVNAAASLRRLAYPLYPAVYEHALKDTQTGLLCTKCKNPINNPLDKTKCETCKAQAHPCTICGLQSSPFGLSTADKSSSKKSSKKHKKGVSFDGSRPVTHLLPRLATNSSKSSPDPVRELDPVLKPTPPVLWTSCALCGHGGHSACMETWWSDLSFSQGACPTMGCICDCVKGPRRAARIANLEEEKVAKEKGRVKADEWRVKESRAVKAVGEVVAGGENGSGGSTATGAGNVRRDEGRKVRVVEPRAGRK